MQISTKEIKIGRVLHEDDKFLTLEVIKDEQRKLKIEDGDKFLSLLFVRHDPSDNTMEVWTPWEE